LSGNIHEIVKIKTRGYKQLTAGIIKLVMYMRDALKCMGLLAVGLLTAIFLYPLLHELGHMLTAVVFGYKVLNFQLLPLPSVMCEMDMINRFTIIVVGFGGMLLPYFISLIPPRKQFWLWYLWLVISVICLLSFVISIVGIVSYKMGMPINNEDITQIMVHSEENHILYLITLIALFVFRIIQIIYTKPIKRCLIEFGV